VAGLVELAGKEENKAFQSFEELREILKFPGVDRAGHRRENDVVSFDKVSAKCAWPRGR
jgi:hypothetical protein